MVLYTVFNHPLCKEVLSRIDAVANIDVISVKERRNLGNCDVYYPVENEIVDRLPDVPALIDGNNIITGFEILDYLAANPATESFLLKDI